MRTRRDYCMPADTRTRARGAGWPGPDHSHHGALLRVARPARRARATHTVYCDMWAVYIDAIRTHLPHAMIVLDRFHLSQYLSRAVDEVHRQAWRQMEGREKAEFKRTRFLWLSHPRTCGVSDTPGCRHSCS